MLNKAVLDARRGELGLSVSRLARLVGVDYFTVQHWRRGRYGPGPEALARLAKTLGCSPAELLQPDVRREPDAERVKEPTSSSQELV